MQLPCLMKYCLPCLLRCSCHVKMKILFWHTCSGAFPLLNEVQLPCFMRCASIGACWHANANVKNAKKMLYWRHICWNAVAMFNEMHLPFFLKCNWHVYSAVYAMFNKNAVAMFYAMSYHWGMLVWKWRYPVENVLQLPCLVCSSCQDRKSVV